METELERKEKTMEKLLQEKMEETERAQREMEERAQQAQQDLTNKLYLAGGICVLLLVLFVTYVVFHPRPEEPLLLCRCVWLA